MARPKKSLTQTATDVPPLEEVVEELTVQVQKLTDATSVLREAIDDLRMEVEWAVRNLSRPAWAPMQNPAAPRQSHGAEAGSDSTINAKSEPVSLEDAPMPAPGETHQRGLFD